METEEGRDGRVWRPNNEVESPMSKAESPHPPEPEPVIVAVTDSGFRVPGSGFRVSSQPLAGDGWSPRPQAASNRGERSGEMGASKSGEWTDTRGNLVRSSRLHLVSESTARPPHDPSESSDLSPSAELRISGVASPEIRTHIAIEGTCTMDASSQPPLVPGVSGHRCGSARDEAV